MDLQQVLSQVISKTNDIFEAEAGSVALLESDGQEIVIQAAVGKGAESVRGLRMPVTQGVIGWVALHQESALIPDVRQDNRFYADIDAQSGFQTRSIMCAPMQVDGNTIGVIELMNMRADRMNDDGLEMLGALADQAALAVENARLLAETRQRSEEQALLFESMAIVTSDLALETVLEAVSRQMVEALNADLCLISRWNEDRAELDTMQAYANPGAPLPEKKVRPLENLLLPRSVLEVQATTILEANTRGVPSAELVWIHDLKVQVLLLIPLIFRRQTIGLVEIGYQDSDKEISRHELQLAETMTAQAAVTIEHARLYEETIRRLAEAKVLQEAMVVAASTLDFDQVLTGTISALHRTLGIERLAIVLPSADRQYLVAHPATVGFNAPTDTKIRMEESAVGWVFQHRKPLLLPDVSRASYYYELVPETRSQLSVPILLQGDVVAVLSAESSQINAFGSNDVRLFSAIAAELTVALENTRLFDEIRAAEANYRDLFDNANDFILILNSNFEIERVNKVTLKTTGYEPDEVIGAPVTKFAKARQFPRLFQMLKDRLRAPDTPAVFELSIFGKDGREILLETTMRIQREAGKPARLHCIGRNITQRRELEQQLRQTEKLSSTGKLVAGVAHELNNPLTSIIGYATMLQKNDLPDPHREDLEVIFRQAQRARMIVRDLLTFARKINLETAPVDINKIINASVSLMKPQAKKHNIEITTRLAADLPQTMVDPHQLEQVFVNLIINAIHVLDKTEGPRQITIQSRRAADLIHVSFADSGPGIPEDIFNRIFDPFFTTKAIGQGTGLGLSICFGIISEHNGRIYAENTPQAGAIFHIELPVTKPEVPAKPAGTAPPLSKPEPAAAGPQKILVADDEKSILDLLERVLMLGGHTVTTAEAGQEAWQAIQADHFDIVICDILMPDITGPELYQKTIKKYPHMSDHFIFITGNVVDMDTRLFLEKTGLIWLSKPFLPTDIEAAINQVKANANVSA